MGTKEILDAPRRLPYFLLGFETFTEVELINISPESLKREIFPPTTFAASEVQDAVVEDESTPCKVVFLEPTSVS